MRLLYVKPELRDLSQGSRIAFVRQLRHLSQDFVSDYLGLTGECKRRSMTRYEKGDRNPKDERVKKIAKLLNVSFNSLKNSSALSSSLPSSAITALNTLGISASKAPAPYPDLIIS